MLSIIQALLCLSILPSAVPMHSTDYPSPPAPGQQTFMLIHGSWHSAWNWYKVKPLLEDMGYAVIAPDLPGMGRDKTPLDSVSFSGTVDRLSRLLDGVAGKVVLVGHSKNGVLISQLAEQRPEKIEKLVYLAAVLPEDGKSAVDYFKLDTGEVLGPHIVSDTVRNSSMLLPEIYREGLYHDCAEEITEMAKIILSPEPRQTATVPVHLTPERYGRVPRYYIECTEDRAITPPLQQLMYQKSPCKKVYRLPTSHSPFFSRPRELCRMLAEIARDPE